MVAWMGFALFWIASIRGFP